MALLVSEELWAVVWPVLPPEGPKPKGGRPRAPDRAAALAGIVFVLRRGIEWHAVPAELGCWGKNLLAAAGRVARGWGLAWLQKGRGGRAEADGARQGGHEAPSHHRRPAHRRPGHTARLDAQQGQPPRQPHAGADPRRCARRASQAPWPAAAQAHQAACRQGLRPSPLPPCVPRPRRQRAHRTRGHREQHPPGSAPLGGQRTFAGSPASGS